MRRRLSHSAHQADLGIRRAPCLVRAEKAAFRAIREGVWPRACIMALLPVVLMCGSHVPQWITGMDSLQAAREVCRENYIARMKAVNVDDDVDVVGDFESRNSRDLHPQHLFNIVPSCISALCFVLWMYCSPHLRSRALSSDIERKHPPTFP